MDALSVNYKTMGVSVLRTMKGELSAAWVVAV